MRLDIVIRDGVAAVATVRATSYGGVRSRGSARRNRSPSLTIPIDFIVLDHRNSADRFGSGYFGGLRDFKARGPTVITG